MFKKIILLISLISTPAQAADLTTWTYLDESGNEASFALYNKANVSGEEMVTWTIADGSVQMAKPKITTDANVETPIFVQSDDGEILLDLNLGLSLGTSFKQAKNMLKDASYRTAFEYLPETCSDADTAFLIVVNNLDSSMYGYCLTPKN